VEINFSFGDYMPAKKDFVCWFVKMFPYSSIDSDHARSCLAGWNAAEEKFTSTNKPMPKLPTLAECQTEVQSQIWGGGFKGTSSNITEIVYNFISRQLSA
jgi:hypothetical protein